MPIVSLRLNYDANAMEVRFADGTVHREALNLQPHRRLPNIRQMRADFQLGLLFLRLPNDRVACAELPLPGFDDSQHLAGRAIVYLDQSLWSRLASARYGHRLVDPAEAAAAAAHKLAELVAAAQIILPVSSAHFPETGRHQRPGKLPLASTCLNSAAAGRCATPV
jgi:hypothetical protein